MTMEFQLDQTGLLLRPYIHDGYLLAIELPEEGIAHLTMLNLSGQRFILRMEGVERLLCDGFAEGNIIYDVRITTGREPNDGAIRRLIESPHPAVGEEYKKKHENYIARVKQEIVQGRSAFVEVSPSYGCEVFCICATFSFLLLPH